MPLQQLQMLSNRKFPSLNYSSPACQPTSNSPTLLFIPVEKYCVRCRSKHPSKSNFHKKICYARATETPFFARISSPHLSEKYPPMENIEEQTTPLVSNLLVDLEILHTMRNLRYLLPPMPNPKHSSLHLGGGALRMFYFRTVMCRCFGCLPLRMRFLSISLVFKPHSRVARTADELKFGYNLKQRPAVWGTMGTPPQLVVSGCKLVNSSGKRG